MSTLRLQFRFAADTGIPADDVMNTWHVQGNTVGDEAGDAQDAALAIADFYLGIDQYLSEELSGSFALKAYDLADATPRVPIFEQSYGATITATQPIPAEVAICMSWKGIAVSGLSPRRRRNRVYLGPFNTAVLSAQGAGVSRPASGFVTALNTAVDALVAASAAATNWEWMGYSPTDDALWQIAAVWVDDAFDTQRRRGPRPTTKTVLSGTL